MTLSTFDAARAAVRAGATPEQAARELVAALTPDEKLWCLDGDAPTRAGLRFLGDHGYHKAPFAAAEVERVGIPGVRFADGPRGAVIGNATCFPVSMARGATWDPELEERVGDAIGRELRALGATLTGAVCVNLLRHPAWGRAQETYGEDPHHVGELGAAFTRGLQRHVLACVKHFACNSMENARFSVDIEVDEIALHEVYLPHFRRIVDEGVAAVMSAYNSLNGDWCGQNRRLLSEILRDEWGFRGFVISDWIFGLRDAARSLEAGLDVEMPYRMIRAQHLAGALERGETSWRAVDTAAARIVATLLRFDATLSRPAEPLAIGSPQHRALAREVAARSVVLLRNEPVAGSPVLPIASAARIAVVGRLADAINLGDSGSSDVWDLECRSALDGLRETFGDVVHDDGSDPARAAARAAAADVAVVVVGYTLLDEGEYIGMTDPALLAMFPPSDDAKEVERFEKSVASLPPTLVPDRIRTRQRGFAIGGDRESLRLRDDDVALIRAVAAANPRTVVAIQSGSAVVMSEWIGSVPAVVLAWYGGAQAGPGLADVLSGRVNPSARLPFSIARDEADLPAFDRHATSFRYDRWHGWWHLARHGRTPAFPFGFGLSYTRFELAEVAIVRQGDEIVASGCVHNTGERAGADVIQVYAQLPDPDAPARLLGFARVEAAARARAKFSIRAPLERLATRDAGAHAWRPAAGLHRISVARHAGDPHGVTRAIDLAKTRK